MRNCIILGCGRSGTSLASGILAGSGYFMGDRLYPPAEGNPKGYFEDPEINGLNEDLLATVVPRRPRGPLGKILFAARPGTSQRWLSVVPVGTRIHATDSILERIQALCIRQPFCFKDPRFSYTLPVWRPFLGHSVFVCVFRDPSVTIESIIKECKTNKSMHGFSINRPKALAIWTAMYSHILKVHYPAGGDWLFFHYRQLLDHTVQKLLATRLSARVNHEFADPSLERSKPFHKLSEESHALYHELCELARYSDTGAKLTI
jgi:hypothetical protein